MNQSYLVIKSEDRDKILYPQPNDFSITSTTTFFGESGIKTIQGESVEFFYNIPNINARNNTLVISTATQSFPVTVPETFYDYAALATALTTQLNTLGIGVFLVTWNTATYRFNVTSPVPINFVKYPPLKRDLAAVMGFAYNKPLSVTIIGQGADLSYTRNIFIVSHTLNRNKRASDQNSSQVTDILFVVPVYDSSSFERTNAVVANNPYMLNPLNIFYQPFNMKSIRWDQESIGDITIRVFDDQDELLYNPYGDQFSWSFRFSLLTNK